MTVDAEEFVTACSTIVSELESFGDEILGASIDSDFESVDSVTVEAVEQDASCRFGLDVRREGVVYTVLGSPEYEYFELVFEHSLLEELLIHTTLTSDEQVQLPVDERRDRISKSDLTNSEVEALLESVRTVSPKVRDTEIYTGLGSQTECDFQLTHSDNGEIVGVEVSRKVFVFEDRFSPSNLEDAIVSITNTGEKAIFLLSQVYNVENLSPETLEEYRSSQTGGTE